MEKIMERRSLLQLACAIMPISLLTTRAEAATPDQSKVAYHLSDLDKVDFVLGNIRNHYNGMGGPDKVTIALVVHGPALKAFHLAGATPDVTKRTDEMKKSGLELNACINTMRAQEVTLKDLLPGDSSSPTKVASCGSPNCNRRATFICGRNTPTSVRLAELRQDRREARHVGADMCVEIVKADIGRRKALLADLGLDVWVLAHFDDGVVQGRQHGAASSPAPGSRTRSRSHNPRRRSAGSEF